MPVASAKLRQEGTAVGEADRYDIPQVEMMFRNVHGPPKRLLPVSCGRRNSVSTSVKDAPKMNDFILRHVADNVSQVLPITDARVNTGSFGSRKEYEVMYMFSEVLKSAFEGSSTEFDGDTSLLWTGIVDNLRWTIPPRRVLAARWSVKIDLVTDLVVLCLPSR